MKLIAFLLLSVLPAIGARLKFDEPLKEVPAGLEARIVTADFTFTNVSDGPVNIVKYEAGCSCMSAQVADGKMRYAPGETGTLRANFEVGNFQGTVDKGIALWLDGDAADKPSVQITLRINIPVLIQLEPKTLTWNLNGPNEAQTIDVKMDGDKPIHIVDVSSSSDMVTTEVRTVEKGRHYQIVVTPSRLDTPAMSIIRVETDTEVSKFKIQQAFAVIRAPLPKPSSNP